MPKPIRSISTVRKMIAARERVAGIGATMYVAPFRSAPYAHLAPPRRSVRARAARPLRRQAGPLVGRRVLPRRPVPRDRKHLQPQGRTAVGGSAAWRVRDVPLARLGVQRD